MIVGMAVVVVLAIGLVVLVVVGDEVVQREAVVRGDEVDAGPGPAAAPVEEVGRPVRRAAKSGSLPVAFQIAPHRVAEPSFHSAQPGGKCRPDSRRGRSQGSAISFTLDSTGSCRQASRKPPPSSKPCGSRARIVARSKRKPSTCISVDPVAQASP